MTPAPRTLRSRIGGAFTALAGRALGAALKTYDADWFIRFMRIAYEEDSSEGTVMQDPMRQNPWVNIAVTILASNLARAPFKLYQGENEVTSGPVFDLFANVNPSMSSYQLWEATESWMSTRGEAIWVFDRDFAGTDRKALPKEIWTPDPRRFRHRLNPEGTAVMMWVAEGQTGEGKRQGIPYLPDQVIHFRDWNPWDEWRGVNPLLALSEEAIADWLATRSMRRMFENDSTPGGVLSSDQPLTEDQARDLQEMWEAQHRGMSKRHRLAVLGFGTKYQSIQRTPEEMNMLPMRKFTRSMILARLGVPPRVVGVTDEGTPLSGSDTAEQLKQLWTMTLIPKLAGYQDKLRTDFFTRFALTGMTGQFDLDVIEELKTDLNKQTERELKEVAAGTLTIDEYRERRKMSPVPWGRYWWVPFSMAPAGSEAAAEEVAPKAIEHAADPRNVTPVNPLDAMSISDVRLLAEGNAAPNGNGHKPVPLAGPIAVEAAPAEQPTVTESPEAKHKYSPEYREGHWKAMVAWLDPLERHYTKALQSWLFAQRSRILEALAGGKAAHKADNLLLTFDGQFGEAYWKDQLDKLKKLSGEELKKALAKVGDDVERLLRDAGLIARADAFDIYDTGALAFLDSRVNQGHLADITDTIRRQLRDVIAEGQRTGQTIDDIAAEIRTRYDVAKSRATTIARTELGGIIGDSRYTAFKSEGFEETEWLSAKDEKVRPTHQIDGEKVKMDEAFSNGLLYPNDPAGPPEEVINCYLPGTRISGRVIAGLKAFYSGPAVELVTAGGNRLSVTPNHPVLTADGWWKRAADIAEGDALTCYSRRVEGTLLLGAVDDQEEAPPLVEDAFDALRVRGSTMVAKAHLHGDGIGVEGEVEIVGATRNLLVNGMTTESKDGGNGVLEMSMDALPRFGASFPAGERINSASGRGPGAGTLTLDKPAVVFHARPLQKLSIGSGSDRDAAFLEAGSEQAATDARFAGEELHADSRLVALDERGQALFGKSGLLALALGPVAHLDATVSESAKEHGAWDPGFLDQISQSSAGAIVSDEVIEVRNLTFTGHVYDLQSVGGWIVAQNIVCGNCRCLGLPVFPESQAQHPPEAQKVLETIRPLTVQAQHLPEARKEPETIQSAPVGRPIEVIASEPQAKTINLTINIEAAKPQAAPVVNTPEVKVEIHNEMPKAPEIRLPDVKVEVHNDATPRQKMVKRFDGERDDKGEIILDTLRIIEEPAPEANR